RRRRRGPPERRARGRRGARRGRSYAQPMSRWRELRGSALRPSDEGRSLTVAGWVARRRDLGGLIFVDLRDEGGIVQVVINPDTSPAAAETAHQLRNEFV